MTTMPDFAEVAKVELAAMADCLDAVVGKVTAAGAAFAEVEAVALAAGNEAIRRMLQRKLQGLADSLKGRVEINGVLYGEHEDGTVGYHSLVGTLPVTRCTSRQVGVRNGPTVVPLDLAAGLIERMTPALAKSVAAGFAKDDLRSHEEDLHLSHRDPPSRTTMERAAKRIAQTSELHQKRIEADVRRAELLPEGAKAIHAGLDRTSVPMAESPPPPVKPPRRRHNKPYLRKIPAPVTVNYRMAYVGTVSIVDEQGDALVTRKYAAPACDDPQRVVERMVADVRRGLQQNPALSVGVVQDGAPEMWNQMREGLDSEPMVKHYFEAIDRYHLAERLGKALDLIDPDAAERTRILDRWRQDLEHRDSAIDSIEHQLTKHLGWLTGDAAEKLAEHLVYIANNKDRMRYVTIRGEGLPVGSGTTEGAGKSVINKRCKGSGQRWGESGLRDVLALRSWHCSERFDSAWRHLSSRYTAKVTNA